MNNIFANSTGSINKNNDYVKRLVEKDSNSETLYSPMAPPEAYQPPPIDGVSFDDLHSVLQYFMIEHKTTLKKLEDLESVLLEIKKEGINKERNKRLGDFFSYLDENIVMHNLKEQRALFPLIHDRMLENGEHGIGPVRDTAVDMLENDHIKMMELATLTFSLMGVASRLTDPVSNALLTDTAIEQGLSLVEMLRLHIFREDNVVFPLAHKYMTKKDFEDVAAKMKKYFSVRVPDVQSAKE